MKGSKVETKTTSSTDGHSAQSRPSSTGSNASHLARIRENQRRSRARRKEYLQELEEKFRKCEQAGVEASHEMQQAAKRVLEENRRLRAVLRSRGIDEHEIEKCSSSEPSPVAFTSPFGDHSQSSATTNLETLLTQRRPCPVESKPADQTNDVRGSLGGISTASTGASPADMTHASSVASTIPSPPYSHSSPHRSSVAMSADPSYVDGLVQGFDLNSTDGSAQLQQQYIQAQLAASMLAMPMEMSNDPTLAGCFFADVAEPQMGDRTTMPQQQQQQQQQRTPCTWASSTNAVPCFLQQDMLGCQGACGRDSILDTSLVAPSFL